MAAREECLTLPASIVHTLNTFMKTGAPHLDLHEIIPKSVELECWHVAHIIMFLVGYGGNSHFRGPIDCPIKTVRVTTHGPAFDLQALAYGTEVVLRDIYPQLKPLDLLVLGLMLSINLCREDSTLELIDVSGNAIAEQDFTKYILTSLSLSGKMSSNADEIVRGKHTGGTLLLLSTSLHLVQNDMITGLLKTEYYIPPLLKSCDSPKIPSGNIRQKCSPIKFINFGRNDVVSFFPFFNHHPQLQTVVMSDTEFGGHVPTFEELGVYKREIQKINIEDEFTQSLRHYAIDREGVEAFLHIETLHNGPDTLIRSTMNTWSTLRCLNLRNCGIFGASNPTVLIKALGSRHCIIEELDLSFNPFTCQNVVDIIDSLQINESLKILNLNTTCEFGRINYKLSLDPDPLPDNSDRKLKTEDECENEFNSMMDKMANALMHNDTLLKLDLGNTELVGTHIIQLNQALCASTTPLWHHENTATKVERSVVGEETVSFLRKKQRLCD